MQSDTFVFVVLVPDLHHALRDDRPGVDAVVDEVDGAAGDPGAVRERVPYAVGPGKLGRRAGWVLTNRPPNRARNSFPTIFMNPAETTRSGSWAATDSASAASHSSRVP